MLFIVSFFRRRKHHEEMDIWPGFVDALSTVLLVFIFVLVGFISSQIYLSGIIFDKDSSLSDLQSRLASICSLFDAEKDKTKNLEEKNVDLAMQIESLNKSVSVMKSMFSEEEEILKKEKDAKASLEGKIDSLTRQLEDVLAALAAEQKTAQERQKSLDYIKKENIKLNELGKMNAYRSEFFDKMQNIVKDKKNIKIVGDRFIFQSELFFDSASDILSDAGSSQVSNLAEIIKDIGKHIPKKIKWILRVDGHTDKRPLASSGKKFASNWELSAARAISVVKELIKQGVPPEHLVAAGFGENQPITNGTTQEDFAKNRRIEFKLDER